MMTSLSAYFTAADLWSRLPAAAAERVVLAIIAAAAVAVARRMWRGALRQVDATVGERILAVTAPEFAKLHADMQALDRRVEHLWRSQAETIRVIVRDLSRLQGEVANLRKP